MNLVELLYRALEAKIGIVITTSDPHRCRTKLYQARAEACNPDFEQLSIRPSHSNPTSELWVLRKAVSKEK